MEQETYLERIKKLKSSRKITNDKLSEMTGIPLGTLSKLLAGISDSPKLSNIVAISRALDCSLDWLITGVPENTNNYTLEPEEMTLVESYRELDSYGRALTLAVMDMERTRAERQADEEAIKLHDVARRGARRGVARLRRPEEAESPAKIARCKEMLTEEGKQRAADTCKYLGIDGLVCCGGDGTFRGARALSKYGINVIGIPATIDNDISCTNYCIGFDTAANTAIECIDKLRDTMQSHERCSVVEVMGRNAGYLAMYVGLAVGATAVLVPETPIDFEHDVIEKIRQARFNGFTHYMIVVAEGAGDASDIAKQIKDTIDLDPRVTVLGHIQRGGVPTGRDRVNATKMGYMAVELLLAGKTNRIVATHEGGLKDVDIDDAFEMKKSIQQIEMDVLRAMTGI